MKSALQRQALEYIEGNGGSITARAFAELLAGEPRSIRAMFRKGLISGDAIPASIITITTAGRTAIGKATGAAS